MFLRLQHQLKSSLTRGEENGFPTFVKIKDTDHDSSPCVPSHSIINKEMGMASERIKLLVLEAADATTALFLKYTE